MKSFTCEALRTYGLGNGKWFPCPGRPAPPGLERRTSEVSPAAPSAQRPPRPLRGAPAPGRLRLPAGFAGFPRTSGPGPGPEGRCRGAGPGPRAAAARSARTAAGALTYCDSREGRVALPPGALAPSPGRGPGVGAAPPRSPPGSCRPAASEGDPAVLSAKLQSWPQTSGGKAASRLDSEGPCVGGHGCKRRPGWSFPFCAQARSRDICFPYVERQRQILDYVVPGALSLHSGPGLAANPAARKQHASGRPAPERLPGGD